MVSSQNTKFSCFPYSLVTENRTGDHAKATDGVLSISAKRCDSFKHIFQKSNNYLLLRNKSINSSETNNASDSYTQKIGKLSGVFLRLDINQARLRLSLHSETSWSDFSEENDIQETLPQGLPSEPWPLFAALDLASPSNFLAKTQSHKIALEQVLHSEDQPPRNHALTKIFLGFWSLTYLTRPQKGKQS